MIELPRMTMGDILQVGLITLIANAFVAFLLNVSVVLLVCIFMNYRLLVYHNSNTNPPLDRQDKRCCPHHVRRSKGYPASRRFHDHLR